MESNGNVTFVQLMKGLRATLSNWWLIGPLTAVFEPSRIPPRKGLSRARIGRQPLTLRLRNGWRVRCRVNEFSPFVEIFVRREYMVPGIDLRSVRSIVDVGANIGLASIWFAMEAPAAHIISVEPGAEAEHRLRENVSRNSLDARVTVVRAALGGSRGSAEMVSDGLSVLSKVRPASGAGARHVKMLALKDLLDDFGMDHVDVLKLDCEGAEYDILRSGHPAVLQRVGAVVGEYHLSSGRRAEELADLLREAGFSVTISPPRGDAGLFLAVRDGTPRLMPEQSVLAAHGAAS